MTKDMLKDSAETCAYGRPWGRYLLSATGFTLALCGIAILAAHLVAEHFFSTSRASAKLPPAGSFLPGSDRFTFAVMGDSGMQNSPMEKIFRHIRTQNPAFILHVGDIATKLSGSHFEWVLQELDEDLAGLPFYAVPGNHDIAQKGQDTLGEKGDAGRFYDRAFGQRHYWFSYGDTLIVGLDNALGLFGAEQIEWAARVMEKLRPQFTTCVIFMHRPPVDFTENDEYQPAGAGEPPKTTLLSAYRDDLSAFRKLVKDNRVDIIFCGHIHQHLESNFGGARLITLPPSGQEMRGETLAHGYALCTIDNSQASVEAKVIPVTTDNGMENSEFFFASEFPRLAWLPWAAIACVLLGTGLFTRKIRVLHSPPMP